MSLKPLHSDCLRRASRTFLRKSSDCMPFFQGLIVSLLSITVNPTPSRLPSPGRCADHTSFFRQYRCFGAFVYIHTFRSCLFIFHSLGQFHPASPPQGLYDWC